MTRSHRWKIALAALTATLLTGLPARAQDTPPPGVEVQARGPIHEAYAESVAGQPQAAGIVPKQPPADIEEMPPDQKPEGDNVQWMPGYWAFDEEKKDFLWVSGFWRVPPPNRTWVPGHWKDADGGWQWVAGFWGSTEQEEVTYLPPPPAPVPMSAIPPAPSKNHVWVPGCWVWREDHYVWRPGYYILCQPNWIWVPAHYAWTPCGYVFVEGYWDHTLKERGILFAPVSVDVAVIRPGYIYTPTVIVHDECLYGAMFVRPGCRCYYFGDYFEPAHREAGYVAWTEVSVGYGDPMFSYYRWEHREDPRWEVDVQITFAGRYKGDIPRPARTLVQQNTTIVNNTTIINNTSINNTNINNTNINNTNINNTAIASNRIAMASGSMVMPLSQASSKGVKLQPVTQEQRQAHYTAAKQVVQASQQRREAEKTILAQGPPPSKPTDRPRTAKLDLPKPNPAAAAAAHSAPTAHSEMRPAATATAPHPASNPAAAPAATHPAAAATAHPTAPAQTHPMTPAAAHPTTPSVAHPAAPAPAHPATPAAAHPATPMPTHPATPAVAHPTTPIPTYPTTPTQTHPTTPANVHPTAPGTRPTTPAPARPATPAPAHPAPAHTPPQSGNQPQQQQPRPSSPTGQQ